MNTAVTTNEILAAEYASYRKVYRVVFWSHYVALAVLFIYLCKLIVDSHGFIPSRFLVFVKEALSMAGIFYIFYMCDTKRGLLKCLWYWERSLFERLRREEGMDAIRSGGIYVIDDWEMTLVEGFLVPKERIK